MARYNFDIETNGLLDELNVVHCLVLKDLDTDELISCADQTGYTSIEHGLHLLESADYISGHNIIKFDLPALKKVYPKFTTKATIRDTTTLSRLIFTNMKEDDIIRAKRSNFPKKLVGRHSLESWGYRLGDYKGDFGKDTDWSEWSPSMQVYCEQDVEVQTKLIRYMDGLNYSPEAIELEHQFQEYIFEQEQHGWRFDRSKCIDLYGELVQRRTDLEKELQDIFPPTEVEMKTPAYYEFRGERFDKKKDAVRYIKGMASVANVSLKSLTDEITKGPCETRSTPFNPGSTTQIANRLIAKYGWEPEKFTPGGKPAVDEDVMGSLDYPEAGVISEYLVVKKRIGQIAEGSKAWLKLVTDSGRIHGRVITNGAVTGRCTHMDPNVAQTPSIENQSGVVPYGAECRALWRADEGMEMVGADASGLELRNLGHFMAAYDGGEYIDVLLNGDIHTVNQKAAGLDTRAQAKRFIYAFLYGAGDELVGQLVGGDAAKGAAVKRQFLAQTPALAKLQRDIKQAAGFRLQERGGKQFWRMAADGRGWLKGLDGRRLHVRSPHSTLNTVLQSAGALVMKKAAVLLREGVLKRGWDWCGKDVAPLGHIHDEFQLQARPEIAVEVGELAVQSIKDAGEHFKFRCPLDGEYRIGSNWKDTH